MSLVAHDSVEALEEEFNRIGPDRVAAFFCEPVMGAGGVLLPGERYIEGVAALCERHGVLFVCDSVICGFGRLGTWFGIERFDASADMIVFAKGVTSGYLPLGGVVVERPSRRAPVVPETARPFRQGTTYAGHPTCCAAALTNLDIIEEEGLLARSLELESELADVLHAAAATRLGLASCRRFGLDLVFSARSSLPRSCWPPTPAWSRSWELAVRSRGVMVRPLGSSIAVSPPLICTREHLELIGDAISGALAETVRSAPARTTT